MKRKPDYIFRILLLIALFLITILADYLLNGSDSIIHPIEKINYQAIMPDYPLQGTPTRRIDIISY